MSTAPLQPDAPFRHEIRVGWGDCDPARIAYTARLPAFALDAIDAFWEHHLGGGQGGGWYHMELDLGFGTPFVGMSLDFRAPVTPRHRLVCTVWPQRLGRSSITFRVEGHQDGILCFEGQFTNVFTHAGRLETREPPAEVRRLIEGLIPSDAA
ncbi:MAG: acyl-CoA thioesterase [Pararhodobacter sp.]|nr:acyl-CoA thioesterase [Pararhodobacter sp.]